MSNFLYFLSGVSNRKAAQVAIGEAGLRYAIPGGFTSTEVTEGPSGGAGLLVAKDTSDLGSSFKMHTDQVWRAVPGSAIAWMGFYPAESECPTPHPDGLLREDAISGHTVRLGDGNDWVVPLARAIVDGGKEGLMLHTLPQTVGVDAKGAWSDGEIIRRFRPLNGLAERWWDKIIKDSKDKNLEDAGKITIPFSENDVRDGAMLALAVNYRVSPIEVAALELFDTANIREILGAVIDWPGFQELIKKKRKQSQAVDT